MTLTKDRIIESVSEAIDIPKTRATTLVEHVFEALKATLATGDDVLVSGFGKFTVHRKKERIGRNPATGAQLTLRGRKIVTFSASPVLRKRVTEKGTK